MSPAAAAFLDVVVGIPGATPIVKIGKPENMRGIAGLLPREFAD